MSLSVSNGSPSNQKSTLKRAALLAVSAASVLTFAAPDMAAAAPLPNQSPSVSNLSSSDRNQIAQYLAENGVPKDTIQKILANLDKGILPDSDNGSSPVSTSETTENGLIIQKSTYQDGSVSVTKFPALESLDKPRGPVTGSVSTQGVSDCKKSVSHYSWSYNDCLASGVSTLVSIRFRFNYGANVGSPTAAITKYWSQSYQVRGGNISDPHFERLSSSHIRFGGTINGFNGLFSSSRFLDLSVKGYSATAKLVD